MIPDGFVLELNGGIGRSRFNNASDGDYAMVCKLDFNLGYIFLNKNSKI